jgi:hypothetical protein
LKGRRARFAESWAVGKCIHFTQIWKHCPSSVYAGAGEALEVISNL